VEKTNAASNPITKDFKALVKRADRGDASPLSAVREHCNNCPELWERVGNVAASVERHILSIGFKGNVREEAISRRLKTLREGLAGPSPTPLERLLVERVVVCWLHVNYADGIYFDALEAQASPKRLEFFQRRQDRAHWRYLAAIRTLAQVRRLLLPAVQFNIGIGP